MQFWTLMTLLLWCFPTYSIVQPALPEQYATARQVRCMQGHDAAAPLYQSLLENNPHDGTTATRLAASPFAMQRLQQIGYQDTRMMMMMMMMFRTLLQQANYTSAAVNALLGAQACPCPVYIKPATAGQTNWTITQPKLTTPLSVLVALFLLGLAVPRASLPDEKWLKSGIVFPCDFDASLVIAYASLYPFDLPTGETLYVVTDWHPHVLSTTRLSENEEPVMYLGPDSLALADHFILGLDQEKVEQWLDLCTGSGIQAILAVKRQLCQQVVCVDVNSRALRLAAFNARLNQIDDAQITFLQRDLLQGDGLEGNYQVITANPPFLPVPPQIPANRHGWFSSGGPSGDAVLQAILHQAPNLLEEGGQLAMVSEFFAQNGVYTPPATSFGQALLWTNAIPLNVTEYARRRADSNEEYLIWCDHLADYDIMSPGLLYLHHTPFKSWKHVSVPLSSLGSLWTPGNTAAIHFTRTCSQEYLGWFR